MISPDRPTGAKLKESSQTQLVWVLAIFVVLTGAILASPVARLALYLFPAMAFAVAMYTYVKSKPTYASLVCWLWVLTPFVRRIVDWRAGWIPATLVLTAPMLACYASLPFLLFDWKRLISRSAPVLVALAAICYGIVTAVLNHNHLATMASALAFWSSPVCFGLFVCHHRAQASGIFNAIRSAFIWALPVMAIYALVQYFILPPWDSLWMENSELVSIGIAAPLQFRVFGTLNSPQALGSFLAIGLLFTFQARSKLKFASVPLGLVALALTGARSAWLGFVLGLLYLFFHLPNRQRLQIAASAGVALLVLLVALQSDAKRAVFDRFQSLTDPTDNSLTTRYRGYSALLPKFLEEPYGSGVGYPQSEESQGTEGLAAGDSAVISLLLSFGLLGTSIYLFGLAMLLRGSMRGPSDERTVLKACFIAIASEALLTNVVQGQSGFLLWSTAALCFQSGHQVLKAAGDAKKAPSSAPTRRLNSGVRALPSS